MTAPPEHQVWFTVAEAGAYSRRHPKTVLKALESGELRGYQNGARGKWSVHFADIDAWIRGERPSNRLRSVPARRAS